MFIDSGSTYLIVKNFMLNQHTSTLYKEGNTTELKITTTNSKNSYLVLNLPNVFRITLIAINNNKYYTSFYCKY